MAENKKSFVLYQDQKEIFNGLSDKEAGQLIKHIYSYISDESPEPETKLLKIAFEPIKNQLKRDLKRYEAIKDKRSEAGKKSAESKKANKNEQQSTNSTLVDFVQQTSTKSTENVKCKMVNENVINSKHAESVDIFEIMRMRTSRETFSDNLLKTEAARFKKKYENENITNVSSLVSIWVSNLKPDIISREEEVRRKMLAAL